MNTNSFKNWGGGWKNSRELWEKGYHFADFKSLENCGDFGKLRGIKNGGISKKLQGYFEQQWISKKQWGFVGGFWKNSGELQENFGKIIGKCGGKRKNGEIVEDFGKLVSNSGGNWELVGN